MVFDNTEATFEFDPFTNYLVTTRLPVQDVTISYCCRVTSCTGCDPAEIWNGNPWTHTNIMKLSNLLFLFSWVNIRSVRPIRFFFFLSENAITFPSTMVLVLHLRLSDFGNPCSWNFWGVWDWDPSLSLALCPRCNQLRVLARTRGQFTV